MVGVYDLALWSHLTRDATLIIGKSKLFFIYFYAVFVLRPGDAILARYSSPLAFVTQSETAHER